MPTVAEIIWEITSRPCYNRRTQPPESEQYQSCERINCTEWVAHDQTARNTAHERIEYSLEDFGEPTVDDMLTWIQARGCDVAVDLMRVHRSERPMRTVRIERSGRYPRIVNGPSLQELLSALVVEIHQNEGP